MNERTGSPRWFKRGIWAARVYEADGRRVNVEMPGIPPCTFGAPSAATCDCEPCRTARATAFEIALARQGLTPDTRRDGFRPSGPAPGLERLRILSNMPFVDAVSTWTAQVLSQAFSDCSKWPEPIDPLPKVRGVYFASAGHLLKIGWTNNVERRFDEASAWCPVRVHLLAVAPGGQREERAYHRRFQRSHVSKEWFIASEEVLSEIQMLRRNVRLEDLPQTLSRAEANRRWREAKSRALGLGDQVDQPLPAEDHDGEDHDRGHDLHHHIDDDLPLDHAVKRTSDPAQA